MPSDPSEPIAAFLIGRTLAEQLGLDRSQSNQWGAIQMAFGLSIPSVLVVHELARRDALAQATQPGIPLQDLQKLQATVEQLVAATQRTGELAQRSEQASQQAAASAESADRAAGQATIRAGEAVAAAQQAATAAEDAAASAKRAAQSAAEAVEAVGQLAKRLDKLEKTIRDELSKVCSRDTCEEILRLLRAPHNPRRTRRAAEPEAPARGESP